LQINDIFLTSDRSYSSVRGYYIGYKAVNSEKPTTFKTVEFIHNKDMEFILTGLQKSTKYLITVQAFNNKGAGPQSQEVLGETLESVLKYLVLVFDFLIFSNLFLETIRL
jgi:hypothetical protein